MRVLEALLLLANLLTFVHLSIRPPRLTRWMRRLLLIALFMAIAQGWVEGPRWQMVPAYAVTALLAMMPMRAAATPSGVSAGWTAARRFAVGLGSLGLALAIVLPIVAPVFPFPHPTGPCAIGTLTYHWLDTTRAEVFGADPQVRRQLMAQVWYPAKASPSRRRTAYMPDTDAVTSTFARIHGKPAFLFGHFQYVTTNATTAAPAADDQACSPVLLFLEGATDFRQMNTFQVEDLASHSYIVAAIDQPGAAANVVFPDGRQLPGLAWRSFGTWSARATCRTCRPRRSAA